MMKYGDKLLGAMMLLLLVPQAHADSYRYMHVTIETPWLIFIFLLFTVLLPFILMAVLYWRNALRRNAEQDAQLSAPGVVDTESKARD